VIELLQRKANPDADYAAAATVMARLGAGDQKELQEWFKEVASALGMSSATVVKAAKHVATLVGQSGGPLFKQLLRVAPNELELYWTLAASVSEKHPRFANAVLLVRGFRDPKAGLDEGLTRIGADLPAFLASVPAGELRPALKGQSLFRLFAMVEAAKGLQSAREQVAFALFDTLLEGPESDAEEFAKEITADDRWLLLGYLHGEFTLKYLKGRAVRNRLAQPFTLNIDGHGAPSHRL
jgi:hypothetical protein